MENYDLNDTLFTENGDGIAIPRGIVYGRNGKFYVSGMNALWGHDFANTANGHRLLAAGVGLEQYSSHSPVSLGPHTLQGAGKPSLMGTLLSAMDVSTLIGSTPDAPSFLYVLDASIQNGSEDVDPNVKRFSIDKGNGVLTGINDLEVANIARISGIVNLKGFEAEWGITNDSEQNIYLSMNPNVQGESHILVFSFPDNYIAKVTLKDRNDQYLTNFYGIVFEREGEHLYLACDRYIAKIHRDKLLQDGELRQGVDFILGELPGGNQKGRRIDVDLDGNLYVTHVNKWSRYSYFIDSILLTEDFSQAYNRTPHAIAVTPDGNTVFVVTGENTVDEYVNDALVLAP